MFGVCWLVGECRAADEGMLMGAGRGLGRKVLEGKARAEQPDRPAASTRVIAEPLCSIQSRCKGLVSSLFIHPPPLIDGAWLSASRFSEVQLFVLHVTHSSWSLSLSLPISIPTPPASPPSPPLSPRIILHLLQITHQLQRPSTNSVTMMPTDGNFLWSCPVIGGETFKRRTAGEG